MIGGVRRMIGGEGYEPIYYDPGETPYEPPVDGVTYQYGTHRWRFGSFSDTRGWPTCGVVWNERLVLAKGSTLYGGVTGDLSNHARYNELGEISNDMAFIATIADPNGALALIADEKLKVLTRSGMFVLGPSNAASGVGPSNLRVDRQNDEGACEVPPVQLDGRTIYVGKSRRRVIEGDYAVQRDRQDSIDLTRYARHIGRAGFTALASTKDPARLLWGCMGDGTLACATYVPEEQVLGWARRPLANGVTARSIAAISDPDGELDQLWSAVEFGGAWHVVRHAQLRQEGDPVDPPMLDMAAEYVGPPATSFGPVPWLAGRTVQALADGRVYLNVAVDVAGMFVLPDAARHVWVGLPYPAHFTTLRSAPQDGALGKAQRTSRVSIDLLNARGLRVEVDGGSGPQDIEQLTASSTTDAGYAPDSGIRILEDLGDWGREGKITVRRVAPTGATVRAIQPTIDTSAR